MACALEARASQGPSGVETPSADPSTGAVLTLHLGAPISSLLILVSPEEQSPKCVQTP